MRDTTFIYVLKDPTTGEIRYVGKSNDPKRRVTQHLQFASKFSSKTDHKNCWIRELVSKNLKPVVEIIDEVALDYWQSLEAAYVQFYLEHGCPLVNGTSGGEGVEMTPAIVEKITKNNSRFWRGKKLSLEHRRKLSLSHKGHKPSDENKNKRSLSLKGHPGFWTGKKQNKNQIRKRVVTQGRNRWDSLVWILI